MAVTAMLLPGLDGTGELFAGAIAPPGLELRIVDYPRTTVVPRSALHDRILAALPEHGPVVLVGESFSGPLALELASRVPHLVGVVLLASFAVSPRWRLLIRLGAWLARLAFRIRPFRFAIRWFMAGRNPALIDRVRAVAGAVAPAVMADRLRQVANVDAREALRTCPAPVLALVAASDLLVPRRAIERLRAVRPDLRVVVLPGRHMLFQHDPAAVLGAIERWLEERGAEVEPLQYSAPQP